MDWGRAKTILIASFLFLNILLGYQIWSSRWEQQNALSDSIMIEETNKLLASKNIRILEKIPRDTPTLQQITVRLHDNYRNAAVVSLQPPVKFDRLSRNAVKDIMAKASIDKADNYQLDNVMSQDGIYSFNQMHGDFPMFDINLQFYAQNGEITGYKQTYVEVQSGGEDGDPKGQNVISAYTAIRSLAEKYLTEDSTIREIRLGYHGQQYDSDTQILSPFWRITLSEGRPYYVQAFSGEVEDNQSVKNNGHNGNQTTPESENNDIE